MHRFFAELWRGLVGPSLAALLGAGLVSLATLGLCLRLITPELLLSGFFVTFSGDDEASLTAAALSSEQTPVNRMELALMGSSASREALESVHGVELRVASSLDLEPRDVTFRALTAGALTHVNAVALVDRLPKDFQGLIVLEISERNVSLSLREATDPIEGPRLPLDSELFDEAMVKLGVETPRRTGVLFLDHYRFFLARPGAIARLWRGPVEPAFHQIESFPAPTETEWVEIERRSTDWTRDYPERAPINLELYRWLIEHLLARPGVGVALLQAPRNPDISARAYANSEAGPMWARFRRDVEQLAARCGVPLWRIDEDLKLDGAMFRDGAHIDVAEGRRLFTEELARRVADWCANADCVAAPRDDDRRLAKPATGDTRVRFSEPPRHPPPVRR